MVADTAVVRAFCWVGANAAAVATREARMAVFIVADVYPKIYPCQLNKFNFSHFLLGTGVSKICLNLQRHPTYTP